MLDTNLFCHEVFDRDFVRVQSEVVAVTHKLVGIDLLIKSLRVGEIGETLKAVIITQANSRFWSQKTNEAFYEEVGGFFTRHNQIFAL